MAVVETSAQGKRGVNSEVERKRGDHGLGASRMTAKTMLRSLKTVTTLRGSSQRDVVTLRASRRRGAHKRGSRRRTAPRDRTSLGRRLFWMIAVFLLFVMIGAR